MERRMAFIVTMRLGRCVIQRKISMETGEDETMENAKLIMRKIGDIDRRDRI
jgi:hypothetical protein